MSSEAFIKLQAIIVIAVIVGATVVGVSVWWITRTKPPSPFDVSEDAAEMDIRGKQKESIFVTKKNFFGAKINSPRLWRTKTSSAPI